MKLQKRKIPKKTLIITALALFLVGGLAIAIYLLQRPSNLNNTAANIDTQRGTNDIDYNPPTEEQKQEGEEIKRRSLERETTPPDAPPTITISRADQLSAGQPIAIRTFVNGTTQGTCAVSLTQSGQPTVTKTFTIAVDATSAICNGDIPASEFAAGGQWQLSITATNTKGSTSAVVTQTIDILR